MLEELGLPYEVKRYERNKATMLAPSELKRVHPLGKAPVVEDGNTMMADTAANVEYLVDRADGRRAAGRGPDARQRYQFWRHYAEGSLMPLMFVTLVLSRIRSSGGWRRSACVP